MDQSHTAAQLDDVAGNSCHKLVRLILGLMSTSLEDHSANEPPPPLYGCLNILI